MDRLADTKRSLIRRKRKEQESGNLPLPARRSEDEADNLAAARCDGNLSDWVGISLVVSVGSCRER